MFSLLFSADWTLVEARQNYDAIDDLLACLNSSLETGNVTHAFAREDFLSMPLDGYCVVRK